jgi:hypothetical protein
MSGRIPSATRFEQEPGTPLGLVDPDFDQAGCGNVMVLIAKVVGLTQARREGLVVFAQFGEHVRWFYVFSIIVEYALEPGDVADRPERSAS